MLSICCFTTFICTFDPFGKGLYRYTFENRCLEMDFPLEDGTTKIFLSTKGKNKDQVSKELISFLRYVGDSTDDCVRQTEDEVVKKLHDRVKLLKKSREWRRRYMRFEELLRDAEEQGREQGQNRLQMLIARMTESGEADRLVDLADTVFLNEMYRKY